MEIFEVKDPINLLLIIKLCFDQLLEDGHIEKLSNCSEDSFIIPIVVTAKRDGSVWLAVNSKTLNKQIYRNHYQMPNLFELKDTMALKNGGNSASSVWFLSLDLKYTSSQFYYFFKASNQCNSNFVGGEITGSYHFKTGFYGLGEIPDNFQCIMDMLVER